MDIKNIIIGLLILVVVLSYVVDWYRYRTIRVLNKIIQELVLEKDVAINEYETVWQQNEKTQQLYRDANVDLDNRKLHINTLMKILKDQQVEMKDCWTRAYAYVRNYRGQNISLKMRIRVLENELSTLKSK